MEFNEFLDKVIDKGIKAAKRDYTRKDQRAILKGSVAGFEACRGKNIKELGNLLQEVNKKSQDHFLSDPKSKKDLDKHWELRGVAMETEWVCNVVSASLYNQGLDTIIIPTARGMIQASKIVGVWGKE